MYQRTQAQSDFPVENAKNLLKEINEEYNVRAVSYGTTKNALPCQYLNTTICLILQTIDWHCYLCTLPPFTDSFFSTNLDETNESIGNFSNAPLVDSLPLTPDTTSDVNTDIFDELIDTRKKTSRHFHVLIFKHQ